MGWVKRPLSEGLESLSCCKVCWSPRFNLSAECVTFLFKENQPHFVDCRDGILLVISLAFHAKSMCPSSFSLVSSVCRNVSQNSVVLSTFPLAYSSRLLLTDVTFILRSFRCDEIISKIFWELLCPSHDSNSPWIPSWEGFMYASQLKGMNYRVLRCLIMSHLHFRPWKLSESSPKISIINRLNTWLWKQNILLHTNTAPCILCVKLMSEAIQSRILHKKTWIDKSLKYLGVEYFWLRMCMLRLTQHSQGHSKNWMKIVFPWWWCWNRSPRSQCCCWT